MHEALVEAPPSARTKSAHRVLEIDGSIDRRRHLGFVPLRVVTSRSLKYSTRGLFDAEYMPVE